MKGINFTTVFLETKIGRFKLVPVKKNLVAEKIAGINAENVFHLKKNFNRA